MEKIINSQNIQENTHYNSDLNIIMEDIKSKIIGVDLDEVLAETVDYCLFYNKNKICWKTVNKEDIKKYYIHHMVEYDISKEEAIEWFRNPMIDDINLEIKPVIWAIDWLKQLKNKWFILKIVTARVWDLFWEYTQKWIEKYYPDLFDDIIYANHFTKEDKTKSELCKENDIFVMVEDNFDYALELAENGIKTYLLEKPWNKDIFKNHKNIIKVKSWQEINI